MRKLIVLAFSVMPHILFAQIRTDKFVGDWKPENNSDDKIRNISIKKVHDNYYLSYNTLQAAKEDKFTQESIEFGTQAFTLRNGYLWDEEHKEKVVLNDASGQIQWRRKEWQKSTE